MLRRLSGTLLLVTLSVSAAGAAPKKATARRPQPPAPTVARLEVAPGELRLYGAGAVERAFVTAVLPDGRRKDVTESAEYTVAGPVARAARGGKVTAVRDGKTQLTVSYGGRKTVLPVTVEQSTRPRPVSFQYEVLPILSRTGCNQGSCHGNAEGRGGFKISLKGENPEDDYGIIVRHGGGRRVNPVNPAASLLLLKATSTVPHGGGQRFATNSDEYALVARWIAEGARMDPPGSPTLERIEVSPAEQIVAAPGGMVRLTARGYFSDGSVRSLSNLAVFSPGDPSVSVSPDGLVTFDHPTDLAVLVRYADQMQSARLSYVTAAKEFTWKAPPANNWIDELNFARLKALRLQPSELSSDTEFLRRAYLDTLGLLPTPEEVRAFQQDRRPDRRARLIDALLERPEFTDLWTMRWSDVLRVEERTLDPKGAQVYRNWIRESIASDKPFDQFARELLTASGSTYANPPANYYRRTRTADELAETTAQVFMGTRMLCAKCHNHPFERWKQDDYYTLAAFFSRLDRKTENLTRRDRFDVHEHNGEEVITISQVGPNVLAQDPAAVPKIDKGREEVKGGEVAHPRTKAIVRYGLPAYLRYPELAGMTPQEAATVPDRRELFAKWLTHPENPFFAKAVVNRIWRHLLGKGIVDPVDDLRESNPASNPALLDALAKDFIAHRYSLRHVVRTIMNSRTYQLSSEPNATNAKDERFFSRAIPQRLPAEVLLDVISQATDVFGGLPANATGNRAINLIPVNKQRTPFLKLFGQPARESACDCERTDETTLGQSFELISGTTIDDKLRKPDNRIGRLIRAGKSDAEIVNELYLVTVSREPSASERQKALAYLSGRDRRQGLEDLLWALINSKEFLIRR
jgi:hypothetical protein